MRAEKILYKLLRYSVTTIVMKYLTQKVDVSNSPEIFKTVTKVCLQQQFSIVDTH